MLSVTFKKHQKVKDSQGDETVEVIMIITEDILARKVTDNKGRMVTVSLKDGEQYLIGDQHPGVVLIAVWILRRYFSYFLLSSCTSVSFTDLRKLSLASSGEWSDS